jgi:rhodanese-related sulfurtransferase
MNVSDVSVAFSVCRTAASCNLKILRERGLVHPGRQEISMVYHANGVRLILLDVRSEIDYNLFHIADARRVSLDELPALSKELLLEPDNTLFVTMSNDEKAATQAWKILMAESIPKVYILEGSINNWLKIFAEGDSRIRTFDDPRDDQLDYEFAAALGSAFSSAEPDPDEYELIFTPKIELKAKKGPAGGGCG